MKLNLPSEEKASLMLDALIARAANDPRALAVLGHMLLRRGEEGRARSLALQARAIAPRDAEVAALAAEILNTGIPQWHFSIVRDEARNSAFDGALRRAVREGTRVLEIGSGTGLLAMMAARAGAAEIVSCEASLPIADVARKVVAENGYGDRIRILSKHSADLDLRVDLGEPVDLLVAEILSNDLLSEGVLPALEQAAPFLKTGAQVIPARGSVRVALANYADETKRRMATVCGFDLSLFNELAPNSFRIKRHDRGLTLLSEAADLLTFNFSSLGTFPEGRSAVSLTARGDAVNGVAQWIHLQMDDVYEYENHPEETRSSNWAVLFYPFLTGLRCKPGDRVKVSGSHDRSHLRVWAEIHRD